MTMKTDIQPVEPAPNYLPCADLWLITTYFNPGNFSTKRRNYERFAAPLLDAGLPLLTVECAVGDAPFALPPSPQVIQVRGRDGLWLKERLINLAITCLPPQAEKIAWLDADILFANPAWAQETSALLDHFPVVQPFAQVGRLDKGQLAFTGHARRSFVYQLQCRAESAHLASVAHGQPGIAWAAQRQLIAQHGLYDAAIVGGGDELFAHATGGGTNSFCVRDITGVRQWRWPPLVEKLWQRLLRVPWPQALAHQYLAHQPAAPAVVRAARFFAHYLRWAQPFARAVQRKLAYTPGMVLHLWHGDPVNRQYTSRNTILQRHHFDPATDLRLNAAGIWEWASDKPALHREVSTYFFARNEDE